MSQDPFQYIVMHGDVLRYHAHNRERAEKVLPMNPERGWVFYRYTDSPLGLSGDVTLDAWLKHGRIEGTSTPFSNLRAAQGLHSPVQSHLERLLNLTIRNTHDREF